jgi:hypothetical protein
MAASSRGAPLNSLGGSAILFRNRRTAGRLLQLLGAGCFVVVALTHVFEAFRVFPSMEWGSPRSVGHYIDLGAAFLGLTLLPAGFLLDVRTCGQGGLNDAGRSLRRMISSAVSLISSASPSPLLASWRMIVARRVRLFHGHVPVVPSDVLPRLIKGAAQHLQGLGIECGVAIEKSATHGCSLSLFKTGGSGLWVLSAGDA